MDLWAIREHVKSLQREIAELRTANGAYLQQYLHSPTETADHKTREVRLQQIVDELARLSKKKNL